MMRRAIDYKTNLANDRHVIITWSPTFLSRFLIIFPWELTDIYSERLHNVCKQKTGLIDKILLNLIAATSVCKDIRP